MYDVIVIGARCAGAPTVMLLARKGYRVLLIDKATFPSDTMSSHFLCGKEIHSRRHVVVFVRKVLRLPSSRHKGVLCPFSAACVSPPGHPPLKTYW